MAMPDAIMTEELTEDDYMVIDYDDILNDSDISATEHLIYDGYDLNDPDDQTKQNN